MSEPDDVLATRAAYDLVASDYAKLLRHELDAKPADRAMLGLFAELVDGTVADIGCGPGRVTAHLTGLGVEAFGIDLSAAMVEVARREHPSLRFEVGSMESLMTPDARLGGIVAWYSIIHTPASRLPAVFAQFHRVLTPGGLLLLAFQVGDEPRHLSHAYGHDIALDAYRLQPARTAGLLVDAGFGVQAQLVREPDTSEFTPQAFILARKL
ncbi:MAG: class I SAM-dependent methyltransferase [Salinibacterium sp.]|nr:class I SAM-dependent methyltransferase [Salinibacterium sp.]